MAGVALGLVWWNREARVYVAVWGLVRRWGVRVGVRKGGMVGGALNVGGTRSVLKVAPALFLIVALWSGQI